MLPTPLRAVLHAALPRSSRPALALIACLLSGCPPHAFGTPSSSSSSSTATPTAPAPASRAPDRTTGRVSGSVFDANTRNFLEEAFVEIPALKLLTLTDNTGHFSFENVPAGTHTLVVSYIGLPSVSRQVSVEAGSTASAEIELRAEVYTMEAFRVTGEREGEAASITRQRNAPNLKSVVDMDTFGNMPNQNPGEVLIRLSGISPILNNEGMVIGAMVRGASSDLSTLSVDGKLQADSVGLGRGPRFANTPGSLFGEVEVIKGQTPDMPAESIGGSLNLKTRTPLVMKDRRRIAYRVGAKYVPPFVDAIPMRNERRTHPITSFSYQEAFDVFGEKRNLGVSLDVFYSENVSGYYRTVQERENTLSSPAYLYDYQTLDTYNHRTQQGLSLKIDYRLGAHTRIFLNALYNDALEPFFRTLGTRTLTTQTVATRNADGSLGSTGNIIPGYTDDLTEVRRIVKGSSNLTYFQNSTSIISLLARGRQIGAGASHEVGGLRLDYNVDYNRNFGVIGTGVRSGTPGGGTITMQVNNLGYIVDRSTSPEYPRLIQTSGPSIFEPTSYTLPGSLSKRDNRRNSEVTQATANLLYKLPFSFAANVKAGVFFRRQDVEERNKDRVWSYTGPASLERFVDSTMLSDIEVHNGFKLPRFNIVRINEEVLAHPEWWPENIYAGTTAQLKNNRSVSEDLFATFLQAQAKLGRLGLLGGARFEEVDVTSDGYVQTTGALTTTAQRNADPIYAANLDWNHPQTLHGIYNGLYPSLHANYDLARNLKARSSWSNTVGRPAFTNLFPSVTASDTARTVTINNPALKPQEAETVDFALEYYFEPVGLFSVGFFHKNIENYIVTVDAGTVGPGADNGYDGRYEGYEIRTKANAGFGVVQGWELSYQQQLSFLPGALRGLSAFANLTLLRTHGDYGDDSVTTQLPGFVPRTINGGLNYRHRAFGARVLLNHIGRSLTSIRTSSTLERYMYPRTVVNATLSFDVHPRLTLFCDVTNLFNAAMRYYRLDESRLQQSTITGTTLTLGISGRF